jgi:hypothetical protein
MVAEACRKRRVSTDCLALHRSSIFRRTLTRPFAPDPTLSLAPPPERVALSRELANFLIELAIALQNHAVYPGGHPFLARSADAVFLRADELLLDRGSVSFGVARDRLVIEGVATEPENPVLSGLAGRLHRHRVGAVTITRGLTADEVGEVLVALAVEAELAGPLVADGPAPEWPHVRLHPLSFANLELESDGGDAPGEGPERNARAPELWIGLARAAMQTSTDEEAPAPEPAVVARAIEQGAHAAAYDQVIVGYLLQLAEELRSGGGRGAAEVRRRLSRLIVELRPETLRRLVEMGGDAAQRGRFLLDASHGFAADAVVRLVEAAAEASERTVSDSLLRLLSKLAAHAERAPGPDRSAAATALRDQVERLIGGWSLRDPNPESYRVALDRLSREAPQPSPGHGPAGAEPERIVQTALEVDAFGAAAWAAVTQMASGGFVHELIGILENAPPASRFAAAVWECVTTPGTARELLRAGSAAAHALDVVCARLGPTVAVPAIMDELIDSELRAVRRAALARLGKMGRAAGEEALRRLDDPRWFVSRNLLALLAETGVMPDAAALGRFLRHEDGRVRREAFKLAFRAPDQRAYALSLALVDVDEQVLRGAITDCLNGCPPAVLPLVCRRIGDAGVDEELRAMAVRVLGVSREPLALRTLLRLVDGGKTLLGRRRLAAATPEVVAAVATLASAWAGDADAAATLALARASADAHVRAAARAREAV